MRRASHKRVLAKRRRCPRRGFANARSGQTRRKAAFRAPTAAGGKQAAVDARTTKGGGIRHGTDKRSGDTGAFLQAEGTQHNRPHRGGGGHYDVCGDGVYPGGQPADARGPVLHHGAAGICGAGGKRRLFCHMSDRVFWHVFDVGLRENPVCTGARHGAERIFCVYGCARYGIHLWAGACDRFYLRNSVYRDYSDRLPRGVCARDPAVCARRDQRRNRPVPCADRAEKRSFQTARRLWR